MGIEVTKAGEVATFIIRNGSVNPLTPAMHHEMLAALRDFEADPALKVGILAGAGERAFSAGDDIKSETPSSGDAALDLLGAMGDGPAGPGEPDPAGYDPGDAVLRHERTKPIIGAVRGWCLGRGLAWLLMLTDIRICSPDARFGLPEIAYGMAGLGGATRLAQRLPSVVAYELALTGEPIDADEALRINLVNRIVPADGVVAEAGRIAALVARHPAISIRVEMEALRRAEGLSASDAYAMGMALYRLQRLALGESDVQASFLYKR